MKLLFVAHLYPPTHNAGGEFFIHNMAKFMLSKGHEVKIMLWMAQRNKEHKTYTFDGIDVYPSTIKNIGWNLTEWSTHILSHLENTPWAIQMAKMFKKPVFFISHNSWDYHCVNQRHLNEEEKYPVNVIYNSQWMSEKLKYPQRSIVLHPPLNQDKIVNNYMPDQADRITIVNSNERKGGEIFRQIVRRMPDKNFMVVLGAYDEQVIAQRPNIICFSANPDIREAYRMTRILLAPSAYESWGMAVSEAMANGIPVICSETPGLKENVGEAGIFVNSSRMKEWMRMHEPPTDMTNQEDILKWLKDEQTPAMDVLNEDDIDMWCEQIRLLDNESNYFAASQKVRERSLSQDPLSELEAVEKFIQDADTNYRHIESC